MVKKKFQMNKPDEFLDKNNLLCSKEFLAQEGRFTDLIIQIVT